MRQAAEEEKFARSSAVVEQLVPEGHMSEQAQEQERHESMARLVRMRRQWKKQEREQAAN